MDVALPLEPSVSVPHVKCSVAPQGVIQWLEKSGTAESAAVSLTNPFNTFRVINRIHCHPQLNVVRCFKGTNRIAVNDPLRQYGVMIQCSNVNLSAYSVSDIYLSNRQARDKDHGR